MMSIIARIDPELDKVIRKVQKEKILNDERCSYREASREVAERAKSDLVKFLESNRS